MGSSLGDLTACTPETVPPPNQRPQPAIRRMQPQRRQPSSNEQGKYKRLKYDLSRWDVMLLFPNLG